MLFHKEFVELFTFKAQSRKHPENNVFSGSGKLPKTLNKVQCAAKIEFTIKRILSSVKIDAILCGGSYKMKHLNLRV